MIGGGPEITDPDARYAVVKGFCGWGVKDRTTGEFTLIGGPKRLSIARRRQLERKTEAT